ncbi:hypothetical protein [Epibacterium ulvae]|uniref:hypothetical protein n=1 Tax=Epibacterium ulvae TaxID=1156985 RepID=UPI002493C1AD|nr:hypothetical protein [Epibacterium ulvae]
MTFFYCVEDELSRSVAERLLTECCQPGIHTAELGSAYGGYGHIKKNLRKYYDLSKRCPVLIITDLDRQDCAPSLRRTWLHDHGISEPLPQNLVFCVAKTEIESWLLADTEGAARFLGISSAKMVHNIEDGIVDTKEYLVNLAKGSRDNSIKSDLTPDKSSSAATGIGYNYRLRGFVESHWNPFDARLKSVTLDRAMNKLAAF